MYDLHQSAAQIFIYMSRYKQKMLSYFSEKWSIVLQRSVYLPLPISPGETR